MYSLDEVKKVDPEVAQAIIDEENRQNSHIELIASENWVSKAVMAAMGSPLTNKYAEGYPGKRYYTLSEELAKGAQRGHTQVMYFKTLDKMMLALVPYLRNGCRPVVGNYT